MSVIPSSVIDSSLPFVIQRQTLRTIFLVFFRLGCTSFGGPVAHLAYFRNEFVERRKWVSERGYADLVALSQFLPGPSSSQVGMGLGLMWGGVRGALAAWAGFTLPSAVILILLAMSIETWAQGIPEAMLHGVKIVAVAVVAHALWGMGRMMCPDVIRMITALLAAGLALWFQGAWTQLLVLGLGAGVGWCFFKRMAHHVSVPMSLRVSRKSAVLAACLFLVLFIGLSVAAHWSANESLQLFNAFYRSGSLVFGGGHVVLPLLQAEVVQPGWVAPDIFLAGYGAAQGVPGPLFTFAAFLGAVSHIGPGGLVGALLCLIALFLPSFLLMVAALPFWEQIKANASAQAILVGVNAAVVGLLGAAFYDPVWTSGIFGAGDVALAVLALVLLTKCKLPPWLVLMMYGGGGWLVSTLLA